MSKNVKTNNEVVEMDSIEKDMTEVVNGVYTERVTVTNDAEETFDIAVRKNIPFADCCAFIFDVVEHSFSTTDSKVVYLPYATEVMTDVNLLKYFTNLDVDVDIEYIHAFINTTDITRQVADVIDTRQFARLLQNIEDAIQFKKDELLSQERFALAQAAASIEDATSQFVKLGEQLAEVNAEELMDLMRSVKNMDELKLAEAAMNQIAGSLEK